MKQVLMCIGFIVAGTLCFGVFTSNTQATNQMHSTWRQSPLSTQQSTTLQESPLATPSFATPLMVNSQDEITSSSTLTNPDSISTENLEDVSQDESVDAATTLDSILPLQGPVAFEFSQVSMTLMGLLLVGFLCVVGAILWRRQ